MFLGGRTRYAKRVLPRAARPTIPITAPPKRLTIPDAPVCPSPDLVVFEYLNRAPSKDSTHGDAWTPWLPKARPALGHCPLVFAMINRELPSFDTDEFWNELWTHHRENTIAFVYADTFRWAGLNISKQVSWERTAQDFLSQLYTDQRLLRFGEFRHTVVRFGVVGAIHSYNIGGHEPKRRVHRLYFDPAAEQYGVFRDAARDGDLIGNQSIFVTSVLQALAHYLCLTPGGGQDEYRVAETIGDGIKMAILRCQAHVARGYGSDDAKAKRFFCEGGFAQELFARNDPVFMKNMVGSTLPGCGSHSASYLPDRMIADERIPVGSLSWNILNQSAEYRLVEIAHKIVTHGLDRALNRIDGAKNSRNRPVWAPVVKLKGMRDALELVDRREIEGFRSVHNLLRDVVCAIGSKHSSRTQAQAQDTGPRRHRPLSIAVFGPPGSGKSYAVSVLAESAHERNGSVMARTFNLAAADGLEQFAEAIKWARNQQKFGVTPVVGLDEFDCQFQQEELGWLKHFLRMMEHWESPDERKPKVDRVGDAPILFFMGGTSYTYRDFLRVNSGAKEQELKFARAKGPDFVSRLSGHIDIIGPNPTDEYDQAYVIRRALVLRRALAERIPERFRGRPTTPYSAWFQDEIIRAMLKVSSYRHGSRSIGAIVNMCVPFAGEHGKYVTASLPTIPQLDMHVDGKEFIVRLEEAKNELRHEVQLDRQLPQ